MDFYAALEDGPVDMPATPATRDPFDPRPLEKLFDRFLGEIGLMADEAALVDVTDEITYRRAVEMTAQAKALGARIEAQRKESKAPYLDMGQKIDGFCRPLTSNLGRIADLLAQKIRPYMVQLEEKRRQAEREALEKVRIEREKAEAERRQAEAIRLKDEAEAKKAEAEGKTIAPPPIPPAPAPIIIPPPIPKSIQMKTESGSATLKTEWRGTVVDIRQLPDACFEARRAEIEKAIAPWINAQIKAGARQIPGVLIEEVLTPNVRAKR